MLYLENLVFLTSGVVVPKMLLGYKNYASSCLKRKNKKIVKIDAFLLYFWSKSSF